MIARVGIGMDVHRLAEGRPLVIGGVTIPHARGLSGHSDADVLTHAVVDAILGALALGDIGSHFPDTDPRWKGADSRVFLSHAVGLARERGYTVGNLDATLTAEEPRLVPHVGAIRRSLAKTIGCEIDRVSVKATTAETLGALGRGEGIACTAVVGLSEASA